MAGKTATSGVVPASGWQKFWSDFSESPTAVGALFVFLVVLFHRDFCADSLTHQSL